MRGLGGGLDPARQGVEAVRRGRGLVDLDRGHSGRGREGLHIRRQGIDRPAVSRSGGEIRIGREGGCAPVGLGKIGGASGRLWQGLGSWRGRLGEALFQRLARFGQEGGGAFLRQAHAFSEFALGAVVMLLDPLGAFAQTATDVLQRLGRLALGLGDAVCQAI